MENQSDLTQWFKRMGYDGKIPESISQIHHKSTLFIWNELIQNVKPKQEVENIRNNIIINRLRNKPLDKQDEFSYPVRNITLYKKKQTLESKLNNYSNAINEKRHVVNNQSKNNKMKHITIETLKSQIKESREREYLLNKKCKMLEKNIQDAEETLLHAKNLTPVELEENPNTADVTDTLQKCAERLEKSLRDIPIHRNQDNNFSQKTIRFFSAQKEPRPQSTFEKYLVMSERKHSEQVSVVKHRDRSTRKYNSNKENICDNRKVNKNLFSNSTEQNNKIENKRESLGLLPDSYLNNKDLNFLTEINCVEESFTSSLYNINEMNLFDASAKQSCDMINTSYSNKYHNTKTLNPAPKDLPWYKVHTDEFVLKSLSSLLYNHNRQIIWQTFQTLINDLNLNVKTNFNMECVKSEEQSDIHSEDVAKLQFQHIQTELQVLKLKAILKDMLGKITKKKKLIFAAINNRGFSPKQVEDMAKLFELQLSDICLDVTINEMKKEINSVNKNRNNHDLQIVLEKIAQTKKDIGHKIGSVKHYINDIYETLQSTVHTRETTVACVRKLGPFVEDLTWSVPLTENLCRAEIETFQRFSLEHNRKCFYTEPRVYYRDITDSIPESTDLNSDVLYMLTNILESPFSPPEIIMLNILKCKMKLNVLKSFPDHPPYVNCERYSLKELQAQESYVQYALDKLNSIIFSTSANKTLNTADYIKDVLDIWLEMPFKDFISPKRVVNGHNYKFYEKQYDKFY